ncbi:MAG: hypothetical protein ACXACR_17325 [Candidatus Hodarchaeales archaeon]
MNVFYLIGGLLSILLSVAHAIWGEKQIATELKESNLSELTKAGFYISWHQITIVLLINGVTLVILSLLDSIINNEILAFFIIIIIIGNISVFIIISLLKYKNIFNQTIPQTILFAIMIVFIILGIFF